MLNERLLGVLSTKENVNLETLGFENIDTRKFQAIITPIEIAGERLGTLFIYKCDEQYDIDDVCLLRVHIQDRNKVIVLEDKADVAAAEDGKLFVVHFRQFFVPDNHIAGSRGVQPAHHVKQGGLAAAGGSHNGHKFAVIYREVHAVKGAGDILLSK